MKHGYAFVEQGTLNAMRFTKQGNRSLNRRKKPHVEEIQGN